MRRVHAVVFAAILSSCAATALPARKPALDPANPDAPESKPLPVSLALAPELSLADQAEDRRDAAGHQHGASDQGERRSGDPGVAEYTCPMHPEVSHPGPGRCPKCGMELEPRKQKAQPGSSGAADSPQHERHDEHEDGR